MLFTSKKIFYAMILLYNSVIFYLCAILFHFFFEQ